MSLRRAAVGALSPFLSWMSEESILGDMKGFKGLVGSKNCKSVRKARMLKKTNWSDPNCSVLNRGGTSYSASVLV